MNAQDMVRHTQKMRDDYAAGDIDFSPKGVLDLLETLHKQSVRLAGVHFVRESLRASAAEVAPATAIINAATVIDSLDAALRGDL